MGSLPVGWLCIVKGDGRELGVSLGCWLSGDAHADRRIYIVHAVYQAGNSVGCQPIHATT